MSGEAVDDTAMIEPGARLASRPSAAVDDRVDLVVVADAEDDEVAALRELGRRLAVVGAGLARLGQRFGVEIAGGDGVAVLDEVLEHREPHAPDADDADALFLSVCHSSAPCHARLARIHSTCWTGHAFCLAAFAASGLAGIGELAGIDRARGARSAAAPSRCRAAR